MKQLKIIRAIKTNNLTMEDKIKSEEQELKNPNTSYTSNTGVGILGNTRMELLLRWVFCSCSILGIAGQDNIVNDNNDDKEELMQATLNAKT